MPLQSISDGGGRNAGAFYMQGPGQGSDRSITTPSSTPEDDAFILPAQDTIPDAH